MPRNMRIQLFILNNLIWAILILYFAANALFTPNFLKYDNIVNIFYHSSILGMLVLGQGLILLTGNLDLSIESTLAFAPAVAMITATQWIPGIDPYTTILMTLIIGALVGLFNGTVVSYLGVHSFIHSLSMLIILRGVTLFLVPFAIFKLAPVYSFMGSARIIGNIPVAAVFMVIVYLLMNFVMGNTPFGRFLLATGGNPDASYLSGVNTKRIVIYAFVCSGVLAALAGLLAAGRQDAINNTMGKDMVLLSFAGAILGGCSLDGGRGTPLGMLGGALLLGMIDNSLTLMGVNVFLLYALYGVIIFLAVLLDRLKAKWRDHLFHRESLRKLEQATENQ